MSCASPSRMPPTRSADVGRRWRRALLSCYRLGVLAAAFFCVHFATAKRNAGKASSLDGAKALPLVQAFLPAAAGIGPPEGDDRVAKVLDATGGIVGWAAQTSPEARPITGYAGPSNLLVVFDTTRRVVGVSLLASADTSGHVAKIAADGGFFSQWNGRKQASLGVPGKPLIVSGASLTSEAMARGVAARFGWLVAVG